MKKVLLLIPVLVGILIVGGCGAAGVAQEDYDAVVAERDATQTQVTSLQAQVSSLQAELEKVVIRRVEVTRWGFNKTPGDFVLGVEEGQELYITFFYGDEDLPENSQHIIGSLDYGITTGILDRDNQEVTLHFTVKETGEVAFMCVNPECIGHHNLHTMPEGQ